MGQGSYVFAEWNSTTKTLPKFQRVFSDLESKLIRKCNAAWGPKSFGGLKIDSKTQWGRTTILPALFQDHNGDAMDLTGLGGDPDGTFRQLFTSAGHQTLLTGRRSGNGIPEDFKIALAGFAFPNKEQHITEIKMQIGDRKHGRFQLEDMLIYNLPAIVFEKGWFIDEEESFELYGFVEGPIPTMHDGFSGLHQRIVPLGFSAYRRIDKVLGDCGAEI